jgi:hypothetical protein
VGGRSPPAELTLTPGREAIGIRCASDAFPGLFTYVASLRVHEQLRQEARRFYYIRVFIIVKGTSLIGMARIDYSGRRARLCCVPAAKRSGRFHRKVYSLKVFGKCECDQELGIRTRAPSIVN